ncbi:alpha/beta hydrolase [Salinibacterium sp. M195]|nr:alpha/beta hydrolase [Salinibacterium sp. M195]
MDWWDDEFCQQVADRGRRVVRYDQRDTGCSTSYPTGSPGYTGAHLMSDAIAVLDELGIKRAHVVGLSMGGGIAQRMACERPDRVATVTLIATTPIDAEITDLPGPTPEIRATFSNGVPEPDWKDRESVVEYIVEGERPYAGPNEFDEERMRRLAGHVFDRTSNIAASMTNHFLLEDGGTQPHRMSQLSGVPALILHGTSDPLFPLQHGERLASSIPGARLVVLDGMGHQFPPQRFWNQVVDAILEHTEEC